MLKINKNLKKFLVFIVIFSFIFYGWPQKEQGGTPLFYQTRIAQAASIGPNNPSSADGTSQAGGGTVTWTNPTYIFSSDNNRATAALAKGVISYYLQATGFGFNIPSDAVIKGIYVEVERSIAEATTYTKDNSIKIIQGGVITGTEHADTTVTWPANNADAYKAYGSSTDLWGLTWTPAQINASNFGVAVQAKNTKTGGAYTNTAQVDHIRITVYYNRPPTVNLNTPADGSSISTTTPILQFTGTDPDGDEVEYEVQVDRVNTFDSSISWQDSYSENNQDNGINFGTPTGINIISAVGQAFTGNGGPINTVKFYLKKVGSPTGTLTAKIYNITGTYGTDATPTGSPLATSNTVDVSTLSTAYQLITFTFPTPYTTTNGTHYIVTCEDSSASDTDYVVAGSDSSSPTHSGNYCQYASFNGIWSGSASQDICFYVGGQGPLFDVASDTESPTYFSGTGDPHPWPSGNQVSYAIQSSVGLQPNTTYYWRVRSKDPSGSNTYGAWSSTWSFTVTTTTIVSVSVSDGAISYGTIPASSTKSTCDLNDTQIVTNNGNVAETFNIMGSNSANWTLGTTPGSEVYVHKFSTSSCPWTTGTALTTSYQPMATNIAPNATTTLNLQITTPTATNYFNQQSVNVTIQAVQY